MVSGVDFLQPEPCVGPSVLVKDRLNSLPPLFGSGIQASLATHDQVRAINVGSEIEKDVERESLYTGDDDIETHVSGEDVMVLLAELPHGSGKEAVDAVAGHVALIAEPLVQGLKHSIFGA